ncbi:MAG: vWA domain-containing protein [Gemmatimonadota bacterium]
MNRRHTAIATGKSQALIIYLIDVSGSMKDKFETAQKIDYVNQALENMLTVMVQRSMRGEVISPRYRIAMAAYDHTVTDILDGVRDINWLVEKGNPTLLPSRGTTETALAFRWARDLLRAELPAMKGCPAPMICHLTDAEFTGEDPQPIAEEIMAMGNDDGAVLIENIFMAPGLTRDPIGDLGRWKGVSRDQLSSDYGRKLCDMSSSLPETYARMMASEGYALEAGRPMLIPGSDSNLIELAFTLGGITGAG